VALGVDVAVGVGVGVNVAVAVGVGVNVAVAVAVGVNVAVAVAVAVGVKVAVAVGVKVAVAVAVGVKVAVGVGVGVGEASTQYFPPVFRTLLLNPPHTIIWLPLQIAVCCRRTAGAPVVVVAVQVSAVGLYLPPSLRKPKVAPIP
jgi:hypothetical protein